MEVKDIVTFTCTCQSETHKLKQHSIKCLAYHEGKWVQAKISFKAGRQEGIREVVDDLTIALASSLSPKAQVERCAEVLCKWGKP